jgi:hypothetical protein
VNYVKGYAGGCEIEACACESGRKRDTEQAFSGQRAHQEGTAVLRRAHHRADQQTHPYAVELRTAGLMRSDI